ncbi:amino acid deaminase [Allokutzneria sp. A3M-2-11 16]|uniref:amino acid deaminase n=1 Tax=Allokutzneria sp. A3M-2-11 16 TaxID=2962043 RepID=UPI0020B7CD43|nr:amino acid deaminase [Allokutzneria sp. A3M-2-11 16]MCP3804250.1 amino acid deaminase [Allokutzneria sp. A3M-2-11 16]
MDRAAIEASRAERIDWRFKGLPAALHGLTIAEAAERRLDLFEDGFLGPVVVLDAPAMRHNLDTMAAWCAEHGLRLAPHGKTTMAPKLFADQLDAGAWGITAANASQLRVYRAFGVQRVVFANQLVDPAALRWLSAELDRDPDFEFVCWADSVRGVRLMTEALTAAGGSRPVDVLVELGGENGRTGARDLDTAVAVGEAIAASPVLRLAGTGGYEAAVAHGDWVTKQSTVDGYLANLRELTIRLADHFAGPAIVTAGGSAYFDQVAAAITEPWPDGLDVVPVLRSGAYVTHDDGFYRGISPFAREHRLGGGSAFLPALHAWAQVTSHPEPRLALLTVGKRDVSFDEGLPEPQLLRSGKSVSTLDGCTISALNDQHAFLRLAEDDQVDIGDWVSVGLSHPCTVFDKWQLIPVVDGTTVVDYVRTWF